MAGPGFLNLHLTDRWHREAVAAILDGGESYGRSSPSSPERVLVEYVSANPTGPLTVAGGRGAAYGDSVARLLEARGYEVGREYLLNDTGGQVDRFAASIAARMRGEPVPEDGYTGEYVAELASDLKDRDWGRCPGWAGTGGHGCDDARIAATLERFGATFDTWFSERSLHESGASGDDVGRAARRGSHLRQRGRSVAAHDGVR